MIKRYGLGAKPERQGEESVHFRLIGIIQRNDGDYVRYTDHKRLLDAAHGALELREGKTIEEHKAEFEDWYTEKMTSKVRADYDDNYYRHKPEYAAWQAWKAAKGIKE